VSLSVIVAVDNRPQMLTYFFDQLIPSLKPGEDEIIVVSDACWDARVLKDLKRLARSTGFVRLIQLSEKVGFGRANNIGVRAATSDTLVFINTDVFPDAGAVQILADELQSDLSIGAVQGLLVYPQTYRVQSTGHIFSEYLNFHALEGREVDHPLVLRRQQRQALTSAFYAIRRETFISLGGFDEFFFNAWEGMELTLRLSHAGMRCIYTPIARAFHVRGGGRRHSPVDETQQIGYFWAKWGSRIKNDLVTLLAEQLTAENRHAKYFAINCGSTSTWIDTVDQLGLNVQGHIQVPDRFEAHVCLYDNVSRAVLVHAAPILFLADHFEQLSGNRAWFHSRENRGDLVIDLRGNVLPTDELA
jgi:GT2 family glycosyltransferase